MGGERSSDRRDKVVGGRGSLGSARSRIWFSVTMVASLAALALPAHGQGSRAGLPARSHGAPAWQSVEVSLPSGANSRPFSGLYAVHCAGAAACVAGGSYVDTAGHELPMIATSSRGHWARAFPLTLPATPFDPNRDGLVTSIACPVSNDCTATGYLGANFDEGQGFITTETHGAWSQGKTAAAPANAAAKPYAELFDVTCTSLGNCQAVGFYTLRSRQVDPMVLVESGGRWQRATAIGLPANATPGPGGDGYLSALECGRAGSCLAVGAYQTTRYGFQAFEVTESNGRWHGAAQVRLPSNAASEPDAGLGSISCESKSFCVAVGDYDTKSGVSVPIAVTWSKDRWSKATVVSSVPSGAAAEASPALYSVSCYPGACQAVGGYQVASTGGLGWMAESLTGQTWGTATPVDLPANASHGTGQHGFPYALSCTSSGSCTVVGDYLDLAANTEPAAATRS